MIAEWKEYPDIRDKMLEKTNFDYAPWFVVNAEDKKTAHIAIMTHLSKHLKYGDKAENKLEHINFSTCAMSLSKPATL
jgi:polyphosphate kinase